MKIYTIGFTQTNAESFFSRVKNAGIELLIDVRLNNVSQLAGFAKADDLKYFLKTICNCEYIHDIKFAPNEELMKSYRDKKSNWQEYTITFNKKLIDEKIAQYFLTQYSKYGKVCLLCSERTAENCHRRLVAENIKSADCSVELIHL